MGRFDCRGRVNSYVLLYVFLAGAMLYFVRMREQGNVPLSWPAALVLVAVCLLALTGTRILANYFGDVLFLLVRFGYAQVRDGLHVVWFSRSEVVISNGERLGLGASQTLQFVVIVFWGVLLIVAYFVMRLVARIAVPSMYLEYAQFFRRLVRKK